MSKGILSILCFVAAAVCFGLKGFGVGGSRFDGDGFGKMFVVIGLWLLT
jgi:hypothetical protein